ncbi:PEP-CTERM sorting domain-containing protein [Paraglaciecola sp. 2405UD69-4]
MKKLLNTLLLGFAATMFNANAAIIDADTDDYNAYKDTDTGLVWLDFGENNNQSYNYVASQLGEGGEWEGWRLPTIDEVYTMWANVANLDSVDADYENPDYNGTGRLFAYDYNSNVAGGDDSVWDATFDVIGFNTSFSGHYSSYNNTLGWFDGTNGLSFLQYSDYTDQLADTFPWRDQIVLVDWVDRSFDSYLDLTNNYWSTLLVSSDDLAVSVSEPTTLAILGLGLLGFVIRRKSL